MSAAFHPLKIAEIRRETPDAVSLRFAVPDALQQQFAFIAGQHVTLRVDVDGHEVRRNYSLCVSPLEHELRVAVKLMPGGTFSAWMNENLHVGDVIDVMPPHGAFTFAFDPAARRAYVGFAGGSGITPILSLMKTALLTEPNSRFTLFYGNRNTASILFLEELASLKDRFLDRVQVFHFLEEEEGEIALFNGRMNAGKCAEIFSTALNPTQAEAFFICGPGPMMEEIEAALLAQGVAQARIQIERFTLGPPSAAQISAAAALVKKAAGLKLAIVLDGRRSMVAFDSNQGNILDSARAAGLPAPFACKGGVCATCRAKVLAGTVAMKANFGLTADEMAQGYVLTCQAAPTSEDVIISYDL